MNSKRLYFGLLGLIGLLFVALPAGAYGANNLLASRAETLTNLKTRSQALAQEQQSLAVAKKNIQKYSGLEQTAKTVVPEDKDQAEAVREIVNIAGANGVTLGSITFPESTLGDVPGLSSTGASTASAPVPAAPKSTAASIAKANLSQLQPVKGIPGVYQLTITIVSDPSKPVLYSQMIDFLGSLEHDRRTAQVNSILITPVSGDRNHFNFTITLNEYIKP